WKGTGFAAQPPYDQMMARGGDGIEFDGLVQLSLGFLAADVIALTARGGAAVAANTTPKYLYHYTSKAASQNISKVGLSTEYSADGFIYLTNKANLSPIQAQIELALPANRALPTSILRINASKLNPSIIRRVQGNLSGMGAGGGKEFLFNHNIPANLIKIIK